MVPLIVDNLEIINPQFGSVIASQIKRPIASRWNVNDARVPCTPVFKEATVETRPGILGRWPIDVRFVTNKVGRSAREVHHGADIVGYAVVVEVFSEQTVRCRCIIGAAWRILKEAFHRCLPIAFGFGLSSPPPLLAR